jgi:hypothetical protein
MPVVAFVVLIVAGLALQLVQGWVSPLGDALWLLAFLAVALIGANVREPSATWPARLSRISTILLGIYAAGLMAYWIAFDSGDLGRLSWPFLMPALIFAALVVAGWIRTRSEVQS